MRRRRQQRGNPPGLRYGRRFDARRGPMCSWLSTTSTSGRGAAGQHGLRCGEPPAVTAAEGHAVLGPARGDHGVARGQRQDVGAGDDGAAALALQPIPDVVDGLEGGGAEREVGRRPLLPRPRRSPACMHDAGTAAPMDA